MAFQKNELLSGFVIAVFLTVTFGIRVMDAAVPSGPRRDSDRTVTVKATFLNPQSTEDAQFDISLDSRGHVVNLDRYDLAVLSFLRDDTGNTYQSTRAENKRSGHHREVVLVFPRPSTEAQSLELVIKDIAGVKQRSFRWDLKKDAVQK